MDLSLFFNLKNMDKTFTISEVIAFGWEKMKNNFLFFAGLLVVVFSIQFFSSFIAEIFKKGFAPLYMLLIIAAWIIQILVRMGAIKITLDVIDKDEKELKTLFSCSKLLVNFVLGSIVYFLIVLGGLILLIVPGIIWAIKYQFFAYLIIDKNMGPIEAIKKSGEMTNEKKGKLFLLGIVFVLINIAGLLCFVIGLFATVPTTMLAVAYVYRKLSSEQVTPELVENVLPESPVVTEMPVENQPQ